MALRESFEKQGNWLFRKRSFLPLVLVFIGFLWYIHLIINGDKSPNSWWLDFLFLLVGLLGLMIRVFTGGYTPKGTSGRNTKEGQVAMELNQTGIYSMVRHPLYLGNFFMWLAPVLVIGDLWFTLFFCAAYWIYYERIMYAEEEFLRRKFVEEYESWANKTSAFVPKFSSFIKSSMQFSLKNVLRREYNGFFNLILTVTLLRFAALSISLNKLYLDFYWVIIFSIGTLIFVGLKILKKFTKVLKVEGR